MKLTPQILARALYQAWQNSDNPDQTSRNFWQLLVQKKQTRAWPKILLALTKIHREKTRSMPVMIEASHPLSEDNLKLLKNQLSQKYPETKLDCQLTINPKLIGGVKITTPQTTWDLSLKNQLNQLKKLLCQN